MAVGPRNRYPYERHIYAEALCIKSDQVIGTGTELVPTYAVRQVLCDDDDDDDGVIYMNPKNRQQLSLTAECDSDGYFPFS